MLSLTSSLSTRHNTTSLTPIGHESNKHYSLNFKRTPHFSYCLPFHILDLSAVFGTVSHLLLRGTAAHREIWGFNCICRLSTWKSCLNLSSALSLAPFYAWLSKYIHNLSSGISDSFSILSLRLKTFRVLDICVTLKTHETPKLPWKFSWYLKLNCTQRLKGNT